MASWIEKKEIGDARILEDGSAMHRLHFRSAAGAGIAESVTQGYVLGSTLAINGITLTLTGKSTSQDGVWEDVFLDYTLPGAKPSKKLNPAGTIEYGATDESMDVDVGVAFNDGNADAVAKATLAINRGEKTVALPVLCVTVVDTKAFTWNEANLLSAVPAATPAAYFTAATSAYWQPGSMSIRANGGRAEFSYKWYLKTWMA